MSRLTLAEEGLESLFGAHDQNLKRIERAFDVRLSARGTELAIEGESEQVERVRRLMEDLSSLSGKGFRFRQPLRHRAWTLAFFRCLVDGCRTQCRWFDPDLFKQGQTSRRFARQHQIIIRGCALGRCFTLCRLGRLILAVTPEND